MTWEKIGGTPKSIIFKCPRCKKLVYCIKYVGDHCRKKTNICDYKFCPYCGKKILKKA